MGLQADKRILSFSYGFSLKTMSVDLRILSALGPPSRAPLPKSVENKTFRRRTTEFMKKLMDEIWKKRPLYKPNPQPQRARFQRSPKVWENNAFLKRPTAFLKNSSKNSSMRPTKICLGKFAKYNILLQLFDGFWRVARAPTTPWRAADRQKQWKRLMGNTVPKKA